MTRAMGLGPFLDELEGRLEELSADAVRAVVLRWASQVPPVERRGLLSRFAPAAVEAAMAAAAPQASSAPVGPADVEGLVEEATEFAAAVAAGDYSEGVDFEPVTQDWRTFGDESWSLVMDDLLEAAGGAFVAGDLAAARDTYQVLLGVLATAGEGGFDHGGLPAPGLEPTALLDADVDEAKSRFLRTVHDTADPPDRPALLLAAARQLTYVGQPMRLADVEATRRTALADQEAFLPAWIAALEAADGEPYGFGPQRRALLAEAAERHGGSDGLAELARRPGSDQAEHYLDLVDALVGDGDTTGAESAAREALESLAQSGSVQARIAERWALLAAQRRDASEVLEARRRAWRAAPTPGRLVALADTALAVGDHLKILAEEADRLEAAEWLDSRGGTATALLVLAGRIDQAIGLLERDDHIGWNGRLGADPAPVLVPFLLTGGCGALADETFDSTVLVNLLAQVDNIGMGLGHPGDWPASWPDADDLRADGLAAQGVGESEGDGVLTDGGRTLSHLLRRALEAHQPDPGTRRRWLEVARAVISQRVEGIVDGQHRGLYDRAATLVVASAETVALTEGIAAGIAHVEAAHRRHPHHSSYRRALDDAAAASSLVAAAQRDR